MASGARRSTVPAAGRGHASPSADCDAENDGSPSEDLDLYDGLDDE